MSGYQITNYEDKLMDEYPATSIPFSHFRSSLQENNGSTFRWPHTTITDKPTNEIPQLLPPPPKTDHHYGSNIRYDVTRSKHDQAYDQHNIQDRTYHQTHDSRSPANDARYLSSIPPLKKDGYEATMYDRPHYIDSYALHTQTKTSNALGVTADSRSMPKMSLAYNVNEVVHSRPTSSLNQRSARTEKVFTGEQASFTPLTHSPGQLKNTSARNCAEKSVPSTASNDSSVVTPPQATESIVDVTKNSFNVTQHSSDSSDMNEKIKEEKPKESEDVTSNEDLENNESTKNESPTSSNNDLPSYTAMIAQSILKTESNKSTLADIYEYMEKHFPSLDRRGTGWRNCVRHTLSLNECFIKLHRPENGRSCNWAIHPSYYETFSRGDYRKRRAFRKRPRSFQWGDPVMMGAFPFHRDHEIHSDVNQQQPLYPYHPMWNSPYSAPMSPNAPPAHLQHFHQPNNVNSIYPHPGGHHIHSPHCISPDCFCQYNKTNYR